ncbi:MAG: S8 family serine peptidase [Fimbriimonadaceae bacterium]
MLTVIGGHAVAQQPRTPAEGSLAPDLSHQLTPEERKAMDDQAILVAFHPGYQRAIEPSSYFLEVADEVPSPHFVRFRVTQAGRFAGLTAAQIAETLKSHPSVRYAEPDYPRFLQQGYIPNDPHFPNQWALRNTDGRYTPSEDIKATYAWEITRGSPTVVIAVIDTGIRLTQNDLTSQFLRRADNSIVGYNFIDNSTNANDTHGHGTWVAGVIAAAQNNDRMVSGVAPLCKLMPLKVVGAHYTSVSRIANAIDFAIANNARVINISLAGFGYSTPEYEALVRARNANILVVASVHNSAFQGPTYPAMYSLELDNVMSVTRTLRHRGQSYHPAAVPPSVVPGIEIGAPGDSIITTGLSNNAIAIVANGTPSYGSSVAAAHVSGVAALVRSHFPNLTATQTKNRILRAADVFPDQSMFRVLGRRLNAFRALETDSVAPAAPRKLRATLVSQTAITAQFICSADTGGNDTNAASYRVRYSYSPITNFNNATPARVEPVPKAAGETSAFTLEGLLPDRDVYISVRAVDVAGNSSPIAAIGPIRTLAAPFSDDVEGSAKWTPTGTMQVRSVGSTKIWRGTGTLTMIGNVVVSGPTIFYFDAVAARSTVSVSYSTDNGATWTQVPTHFPLHKPGTVTMIPSSAGQSVKIRLSATASADLDNFVLAPAWVRLEDGAERKSKFTATGGFERVTSEPINGSASYRYEIHQYADDGPANADLRSNGRFNVNRLHRGMLTFRFRSEPTGYFAGLFVRLQHVERPDSLLGVPTDVSSTNNMFELPPNADPFHLLLSAFIATVRGDTHFPMGAGRVDDILLFGEQAIKPRS